MKRIWRIPNDYITPASKYPRMTQGSAAITEQDYAPGLYDMYGVRGCRYYRLEQSFRVTALAIDGKTWMVDDPTHWEAIQEAAQKIRPPSVLIGGLGLGLILHALAPRQDITRIVVVEHNQDVIDLIRPLLPARQVSIVHADFWDIAKHTEPGEFSSLFVDLWVGHGPSLWGREVNRAFDALDAKFGAESLIQMFGFPIADLIYSARDLYRKSVNQGMIDPTTGAILRTT